MQSSIIYKQIKDEDIKKFIDEIPVNIKNKCELIKFDKGKLIALKGNEIKEIHISLQGNMQVKNEFENGFVYSFADVESIAYIGVMEIMANEKLYSSTLQTNTQCIMIKISVNDFINWITTDHDLTLKILNFVSSSMYKQSLNKGEVLAYPAIYSLVSYLINAYESEQCDDIVYLKKTREEIGSILGFSIRTINRNLKELKEENLISVNRKNILITKEQFYKLTNKLDLIK